MTVGQGDPTADPIAGVNAAAHNSDLARRIQMLQDGGHTWMDPQTQVALAGSPMPDHSLTSAGDAIRGLLNNVQQSFSTVFDDPVLHKTPSTSMKVAQWVGDNVGYLPVEQTDVTNIQKQLQAKGFGTGLPTDGVWNAAYNQAYQDAWYAHVQDQQDNQGQIAPVHKVAHGFLSSLGLSHAIPALIGSIKSIPGDVRSLAADTAGGVRSQVQQLIGGVNAASNPGHSTGLTETPQQAGARVAASVENIGNQGKQVTAQDILAHPYARIVNDIGTMLMFVPYGKVGTELARTLGTDVLKDTGRAAFRALPADVAYRGPGVVAKSFVTTGDEAGFNGLGRLMDNTPGLRQLYPVVRKVGFTDNSYYYTTRRALAQPMRNPLINLGARTAQYTSLLGAANRGIAAAEGEAGDKTHGIAAGVYGQGTMTGHWGAVLDLAGSLGKATLGSDPSQAVGDIVKGAERLTTTALGGPVDVGTSFDKAMQAAGKHGLITGLTSKDMSYSTLTSKFGKSAVDDYLNDQLNHFAAAKVAEAGLQRDFVNTGVALTGTDRTAAFLALQHSAWNTPDLLAQARDELVQNPPALLEAFLRQHNGIAQDLSSSAGSGPGIGGYLQAKGAAYRLFKGWSDSLVTPEAYEGLATARQTAADDAEFNGGGAPWFAQGHPQLYQGSAAPTAEEALNDVQPDRYGSGLVSSNVKSRADAADHTYYLTHPAPKGFADLNQPATQDLLKAIRGSLTSKEGRAAHAASTSIAASPQEYQTLRHLMTDKFATGKQVLDAYRKSLENAGALSKDEVQAQIEAVSAKAHANLTGYRYRGKQGAWPHVITNPDGVQAVEKAQPAPIAPTQDFVQGLGLTPAPGRLGLARQDTLLAEDHRRAATEFAARLDRLGLKSEVDSELADLDLDPLGKNVMLHDTPPVKPEDRSAGLDQITKEMVAYLRNEMSLDPHEIRVNYPAKLMATIAKGAKTAATEVHLPIDADPELSAAYQAVKDLGYKVTWGTDIGHFFTDPVIDPAVITGHQSMLRKFVGAMGFSIDHFPTSTPGMYARQTAIADLQRLSDSGRLKMAPGETPAMLLARVSNTTRQPTGPERIAFGAAANIIHRTAADMMVARGEAENREHAFGQMLQAIVNHEGISNLSLKQFTRAVQDTPAELADYYKAMGLADDQPMYTAADAALIYRTVLNAQAKRPASMMGLSKLEDVFRAAPSLAMSKLQMDRVQVPGLAQVLRRASVLPNDLIRVRNKYKFSYSPMFDLRRAAKTSFKMGLEGIPHTISPLKSMLTRGTFDNDTALLNRVMPEDALRGQGFDDMDRYLNTQSIFGFNVRHYMAYAAGELNRQGLGDDEIRAKILHMFTYGDRTALERTMSTLWYPFSFEKTLYRNLGGYLLDHPTQRVMLEWSLNAYHALDKQVGIQDWLDKHLPVAKELEKVNAFADGVGLGQFGGINRPLFNLLLPQQNNNPLPVNVLQAAVPAYNDLNYLLVGYDPKSGTVKNGGAVQNTFWNAFNYYQEAVADKSSLLRQHHPAETPKAQQEDGYKFRMSLIAKAAPTLDWNYHHPNNALVFPSDIPGLPEALRGQKITRSAIGQLTKLWYPAFDPNAAQASSIEKAQALKDDLSRMAVAEPDRAQQYAAFTKLADQIKGHVLHDDYQIPQLSDLTSRMRTYVTNLSEQDPRFYKFYNTYYRSTFGPLENLQ